MSTIETSERVTTLPDDETLAATVVALEEHGFSVEVVGDLEAARMRRIRAVSTSSSSARRSASEKREHDDREL
jgi:hypothetical protein